MQDQPRLDKCPFVELTETEYRQLLTVAEAAQRVYDSAALMRGVGENIVRSNLAMQALKRALDEWERVHRVTPDHR